MSTENINIVGILIDAIYENFILYKISDRWEKTNQGNVHNGTSIYEMKDFERIIEVLPNILSANTQLIIVYDVSCVNKENSIKQLLSKINQLKKNNLLPALVCIGHEQSPWNNEIIEQFSSFKELKSIRSVDHVNLLKKIVNHELAKTQRELIDTNKEKPSMMILGGFIAVMGIAAVAIALTVLNTSIAGLIVTAIGIAATFTGWGLFANEAFKNKKTITDEPLDYSEYKVLL
ncbi:hypothetical protein [Legionella worsleiensis]|uniref:Uncharacterized protein n=1 Tax=Legionella worsleiensis TaxID=45076 RepID=A0A0W1AFU0_9GAMM|nr:hypothetical protein [Legionella worsleiensis]KTD80048.1 hypothetical protein Lwor_1562 [Legionella worsleiensis]STY32521.1 Uncharacterised protein [Legionella worsleiensis]